MHFKSAALSFEVPPFYVVGALVNGARLLIQVEGWDRSYPYKVKQRSGFRSFKQIFLNMEESAGILISQDSFCLNDLTSCVCKTMEHMINDRLGWYLESSSLINQAQSGFRKKCSPMDHHVRY